MNLKSIQRNYEHLTMLERLSLADNAVSRDDEIEIKEIVAASPKVSYSQPDYLELLESINKFRFCNLIVRLSYIIQFDYFLHCDLKDEDRISNDLKLCAFLYVRATDSWREVCEEFCLNPDFSKEICELLFSSGLVKSKDSLMRFLAFTEEEASEYIKKQDKTNRIKTLEDEKKAICEVLGLKN